MNPAGTRGRPAGRVCRDTGGVMDFRRKVKAWMEANGIGQEGLALATGYSQSALSAVLRGQTRAPGSPLMLAIARSMGCSLEWLVDDEQDGPMAGPATAGTDPGRARGDGLTPEELEVLRVARMVDRLF